MPQISLYIDKDTLDKIEKAAVKEKVSISRWVGDNIKKIIRDDYPSGYFELFGSIDDDSFSEIEELPYGSDSSREQL